MRLPNWLSRVIKNAKDRRRQNPFERLDALEAAKMQRKRNRPLYLELLEIELAWPGVNEAERAALDVLVQNKNKLSRAERLTEQIETGELFSDWLPKKNLMGAIIYVRLSMAGMEVKQEHLRALGINAGQAAKMDALLARRT